MQEQAREYRKNMSFISGSVRSLSLSLSLPLSLSLFLSYRHMCGLKSHSEYIDADEGDGTNNNNKGFAGGGGGKLGGGGGGPNVKSMLRHTPFFLV